MTIAFHLLQLSCQTVFYLAGLFCQTVSYLLGQSRQIVCYLPEPSDKKMFVGFSSCTNIFLHCFRSKILLILGVQDISRISQSTQPEFLKVRPTLHWFAEAKISWQMTSALRDDLCTLGSVEHISSETLLHILYSALVSRPHFSTSIIFFANGGLRD